MPKEEEKLSLADLELTAEEAADVTGGATRIAQTAPALDRAVLVAGPRPDQTLVFGPRPDQTLVFGPRPDQTLVDPKTLNVNFTNLFTR